MMNEMNYYWHLKNPDPGMAICAKRRLVPFLKQFESMIEEASKGAFQSRFDQDTIDQSDQRLDFKISVFKQTKEWASDKLDELMKEVDVRRKLENGLPD